MWVDASNKDTLEQSYKKLALKSGMVSDQKTSLKKALQGLEYYRGNWLLLFDGADNLEDVSGLFPPGTHGDIIYTSRNPMLRRLPTSQIRHVAEMDRDEASDLLLKSARQNTSSEDYSELGSAIVAELGYLALAIDQAGAYIASGGCPLDNFLEVFDAHRQHLLQNEAYKGASGSDRAVYATWDLSYAAIHRQANETVNEASCLGSKAALQILQIFPFLHSEGIMEDMFKFAVENSNSQSDTAHEVFRRLPAALAQIRPDGKWDGLRFRQGIQKLLSFSLVGQGSSQRRFNMHRLVHLWAYDRLTMVEKSDFGFQARIILEKSIIERTHLSDYNFRRDLLPHITTFQRRSIQPCYGAVSFALVFSEAGQWNKAAELEAQAIETK